MRFLADNDLPEDVVLCLGSRGHEVTRLRDVMAPNSPDRMVAKWAHDHHAVILTCNVKHFKPLVGWNPRHGYRQYRHAGLLGFECGQAAALRRLEEFITVVEFEGGLIEQGGNAGFVAFLTSSSFRIER